MCATPVFLKLHQRLASGILLNTETQFFTKKEPALSCVTNTDVEHRQMLT